MEEKIADTKSDGQIKIIYDCGSPILEGNIDHLVSNPNWINLKTGDRVFQIGKPTKSGKETAAFRVDRFRPALVYSGYLKIKNTEYLAFRIQDISELHYILYEIYKVNSISKKLLLKDFINYGVRKYSLHFKKSIYS